MHAVACLSVSCNGANPNRVYILKDNIVRPHELRARVLEFDFSRHYQAGRNAKCFRHFHTLFAGKATSNDVKERNHLYTILIVSIDRELNDILSSA
jgi:hypothetical protein